MKVLNRLKVQASEALSVPLTECVDKEGCFTLEKDDKDNFYIALDGKIFGLNKPVKDPLTALSAAVAEILYDWLDSDGRYPFFWDVSKVTKKQKSYDGFSCIKFVGKEGKVMRDYLEKAILDSRWKNEFKALEHLSVDGFSYEQAVKALNSLEEFLNF